MEHLPNGNEQLSLTDIPIESNGRPASDFDTAHVGTAILEFAANYRATTNPQATLSEIIDLDNCPPIC